MTEATNAAERRAALPAPRSPRRQRARQASRVIPAICWTIIGVCMLAFATSLAVPLWYQLHGERLLIVTSGSMAPYFRAGDAVIMQAVDDPSVLKINQVVSFWPPESNVLKTHRIIGLKTLPDLHQDVATGKMVPTFDPQTGEAKTRNYIITQGDANSSPDADATPVERVRGVVLNVEPQWGAILGWAHSPNGRLAMLAPPLVLLAGMELAGVVTGRRRRRASAPREAMERRDDALLLE